MANWSTATRMWQQELRAAGRSRETIRTWTHYVRCWARVCRAPESATRDALIAYLARPGWEPETRKSARTALRSFYAWGHTHGGMLTNPAADLPSVHVPRARPRPAPEAAIRTALGHADKRQRLMILLAAVYALRRAEISQVCADDLDGDVLIVHGKGGAVRRVTLDPDLAEAIRRRCCATGGWLFPSGSSSGHYTPGHVGVLMTRALPKGYSPHQLRHAAASALHAGGLDWLELCELLGHARVSTTMTYTAVVPEETIRATTALLRRFA